MYPNPSSGGILSFIKNLNIAGLLDGTQKTLSVVNQAIPIIYQVKPLMSNLGTIFKISNIINNSDSTDNNDVSSTKNSSAINNSPIFYV